METGLAPSPLADTAVPRHPPSGVWRQSWYRFRRNRAGMIGLFMVVPVFVVILAVVRLFGIIVVGTPLERIPTLNLMTIILLLGLFSWPQIARMTRAEFLRLRHAEFVEAARCIGTTQREILFRHILPNALPPLIVLVALGVVGAILAEAMVSFLGFGDPQSISSGPMIYLN